MRKRSRNPLSKLKWTADRAFSDWIRKRDKWTCYTCGVRYPNDRQRIHAGHFQSRVSTNTRFDERNVHAQCAMCNVWRRGNYAVYAVKLQEQYGPEILKELVRESKKVVKFGVKEYEAIIEKYG